MYDQNQNDWPQKFHSSKKYKVTALFIFYNTNSMLVNRLKRKFLCDISEWSSASLCSLCPSPPRAPQVKQRAVTKQNGLFFGAYVPYDFTNPLDFDSHFSTAATVHATIETILLGTSRMVKIFSFLAPS